MDMIMLTGWCSRILKVSFFLQAFNPTISASFENHRPNVHPN
jgi:hypothetical protein